MTIPTGPAAENPDSEVRAKIHRNAVRFAEANVYSMTNSHLTKSQKVFVEFWFQFPIGIFEYALMGLLVAYPAQYLRSFVVSYVVAGIAALISRFAFLPDRVLATLGVLFAAPVSTIVSIGFTAFFLYRGEWMAAGIGVASAVGVLSFIAPSMHVYTLLAPRGLHCKYAFAKSRFGITFPFERQD